MKTRKNLPNSRKYSEKEMLLRLQYILMDKTWVFSLCFLLHFFHGNLAFSEYSVCLNIKKNNSENMENFIILLKTIEEIYLSSLVEYFSRTNEQRLKISFYF